MTDDKCTRQMYVQNPAGLSSLEVHG